MPLVGPVLIGRSRPLSRPPLKGQRVKKNVRKLLAQSTSPALSRGRHVDYNTQVRTPKDSYHWYSDVIARGGLPG